MVCVLVKHIQLNNGCSFAITLQRTCNTGKHVVENSVKNILRQRCLVKGEDTVQKNTRNNEHSCTGSNATNKIRQNVLSSDEAWFTLNKDVNTYNNNGWRYENLHAHDIPFKRPERRSLVCRVCMQSHRVHVFRGNEFEP